MAAHRKSERALTLIELMVVILILGILASVIAVAVTSAFSSAEASATKSNIQTLSNGLRSFHERFQTYPPNRVDDLTKLMSREEVAFFSENDTNQSTESMVLALRSRIEGGPFINADFLAANAINTDNDEFADNFPNIEGNLKLFEIADGWGNPLVYVNLNDPFTIDDYPLQVQLRDGVIEDIDLTRLRQALTDSATGLILSKTFVIWSFGPNGVNEYGFGDDVTSWPKRDDQPEVDAAPPANEEDSGEPSNNDSPDEQ